MIHNKMHCTVASTDGGASTCNDDATALGPPLKNRAGGWLVRRRGENRGGGDRASAGHKQSFARAPAAGNDNTPTPRSSVGSAKQNAIREKAHQPRGGSGGGGRVNCQAGVGM